MAVVVDSFTDTSGLTLASHTGETGATWTRHTSYTASTAVISNANRSRPANATVCSYYASGVPASADYDVEADLHVFSVDAGLTLCLCGRVSTSANTMYCARYLQSTGEWQLSKIVAGTGTTFSPSYAQALTVGNDYHLKLEMRGTALKLYVDGVLRVSATDSAISGVGRAGFRTILPAFTDSAGIHIDNFTVTDPVTVPTISSAPVISGTAIVGFTLSCTTGTWTGSPSSYAYQWKSGGVNIGGATASTFLLTATEDATVVTCEVTATNGAGASSPAASNGLTVGASMSIANIQILKSAAAFGGAPGAVAATGGTDIFDSVLFTEAVAGSVEYRCVYVSNTHASQSLTTPVVWIDTQTSSASTALAIGVATEAAGANVAATADEITPPAGVAFSAPSSAGAGLSLGTIGPGSFKGVWLRRTVSAGAPAVGSDTSVIAWQGTPA